MASGDHDTTINLKTVADNSGAESARKAHEKVGEAAKNAADKTASAADKSAGAIGRVRKAADLLRGILTGFGVVGVFTALVAAVDKVRESFGAAKKEAEELAKAKDKAAHAKAIEDLAKSYEKLGEAARQAAESVQRGNEVQDIATRNARALEDAQTELAKQKELAAIDPNDPAAAEKRTQIEARYAAQRGKTSADRSREDIERNVARLEEVAVTKRRSADDIENSTVEDDKLIADTMRRLDEAQSRSWMLNSEDNVSTASKIGSDLKNLVTFNWGKVGVTRTEKGDAIRKDAATEAQRLEAELKRLEEMRQKKLKEADALREEASHLQDKALAEREGLSVATVQEEASKYEGRRGMEAADLVRKKKDSQIAKDEKTVAGGNAQLLEYELQKETDVARAQAAADKYQKEQGDVFTAQNRYDALVQNGGSKKEKSAALAALQKEKDDALEAQREMEKVAAEVANTLKTINDNVSKLSQAVKSAQNRLAQNQTDAPEG